MRVSTAIAAAFVAFGLAASASAQTVGPCKRETGGMTYPGPYWVNFDLGSAAVKADQQTHITEAATRAKALQISRVCVIGQADKIGDPKLNQTLAMSRAKAVADSLIKQGIQAKNIVIQSDGEAAGGVSLGSLDSQPKDRRVSIVFAK
jgi:outer membrane protein OmpA-like peptidoglycan-associated protein